MLILNYKITGTGEYIIYADCLVFVGSSINRETEIKVALIKSYYLQRQKIYKNKKLTCQVPYPIKGIFNPPFKLAVGTLIFVKLLFNR